MVNKFDLTHTEWTSLIDISSSNIYNIYKIDHTMIKQNSKNFQKLKLYTVNSVTTVKLK